MPDSACPLMIIVTDGVLSMPENRGGYDDGLMSQLIQRDVSVSFLQICSAGFRPDVHFGYIPDSEMLMKISDFTSGAFYDHEDLQALPYYHPLGYSPVSLEANTHRIKFQQSLFIRCSALTNQGPLFDETCAPPIERQKGEPLLPLLPDPGDYPFPWEGAPSPIRLLREKVKTYSLVLDIYRLIECRAGEGFKNARVTEFVVKRVVNQNGKRGKKLKTKSHFRVAITFALQWKSNVWIEYTCSARSLESTSAVRNGGIPRIIPASQVDVDIHVTADYGFLLALENHKNAIRALKEGYFHKWIVSISFVDLYWKLMCMRA